MERPQSEREDEVADATYNTKEFLILEYAIGKYVSIPIVSKSTIVM